MNQAMSAMLELLQYPLTILAVGIISILGLIIFARMHAFLALLISAMILSTMAPGPIDEKIRRVSEGFGGAAANVAIVIALASIIGSCMMASGAADRIVQAFLSLLGEKRSATALLGSGYVLAMPVFFDTVFYLLVPLARSLYRKTHHNYLLYLMAIAAGGAITHTLVPPTPGPLLIAANLKVDLGTMIVMGMIVALPAALAGLAFSHIVNRRMPIEMRAVEGEEIPAPEHEDQPLTLPWLGLSLLPIVLPVLLIALNTFLKATLAQDAPILQLTGYLGSPELALLLATFVSMGIYAHQKRASLKQLGQLVETSLMSGGVIILITAAGGAFGAMLKVAGVGDEIKRLFEDTEVTGLMFLFLGFGIASVLKFAQGSSTVAMITASGLLAGMVEGTDIGVATVYLALAIGGGSLVGSWMNDSGFWIFTKMGGLTETESLKSWTPLLAVLGITAMIVTTALAVLLPNGLSAVLQ